MYRKIKKEYRIKIVQKILSGKIKVDKQAMLMNISPSRLYYWCSIYKYHGESGLLRKKHNILCSQKKRQLIYEYLTKGLSLHEIAGRELISMSAFQRWISEVRIKGYTCLSDNYENAPFVELDIMARQKKKKPETELEILRYENERLRAENLLLKKVRALVEERIARNKEIGQKPSKD